MTDKISLAFFKSPYGELIIGSYKDALCICDWKNRKSRKSVDERVSKGLNAKFVQENSEVIAKTKAQLTEYFDGNRNAFDIKLELVGTEFQKSVWLKLQEIPYGQTWSYLQLSKELRNEKAIRAVAKANGANALSIIIPCHRIIGSDRKMTGYAGGIDAKRKLLELEGAIQRIQLSLFDEW